MRLVKTSLENRSQCRDVTEAMGALMSDGTQAMMHLRIRICAKEETEIKQLECVVQVSHPIESPHRYEAVIRRVITVPGVAGVFPPSRKKTCNGRPKNVKGGKWKITIRRSGTTHFWCTVPCDKRDSAAFSIGIDDCGE